MHLFLLPNSFINNINFIIAHFIWSGAHGPQKLHLVWMETLTAKKNEGGQGLKSLEHFEWALNIKILEGYLPFWTLA